jgi:proline iminopeptidase
VVEGIAAAMNFEIYGLMWGTSDFVGNGTLKDFDRTADLASLTMPVLFHAGEFDETRPETVGTIDGDLDKTSPM